MDFKRGARSTSICKEYVAALSPAQRRTERPEGQGTPDDSPTVRNVPSKVSIIRCASATQLNLNRKTSWRA